MTPIVEDLTSPNQQEPIMEETTKWHNKESIPIGEEDATMNDGSDLELEFHDNDQDDLNLENIVEACQKRDY